MPHDDPSATPPMAVTSAIAGVIAGVGAIAASSCCIVPLTLASLGAGAGVFAALEALVPWRMPLLVASSIGVAIGWVAWWHKRWNACRLGRTCAAQAPSRASIALLLLASFLALRQSGGIISSRPSSSSCAPHDTADFRPDLPPLRASSCRTHACGRMPSLPRMPGMRDVDKAEGRRLLRVLLLRRRAVSSDPGGTRGRHQPVSPLPASRLRERGQNAPGKAPPSMRKFCPVM